MHREMMEPSTKTMESLVASRTSECGNTSISGLPCHRGSRGTNGHCNDELVCFFRQALDAVESGVLIGTKRNSSYVYANAYAQRLLEQMPEALSLTHLLASDPAGFGDYGECAIATESATRMVVKDNGRAVGLSLYQSRTQDDLIIIQLKDISSERDFKLVPTPTSDGRMVTRIFSQLRHEIGNPLNSIKMSLQVLKENLDEFPKAKVLAYISRCVGEVRRLERLLASLREFSRESSLDVRELDLKAQLERFTEFAKAQCQSAQVVITSKVDERARFAVADPEALEQVLHNLLQNALQAKRLDPGHITLRTRRGTRRDRIVIEVEDDGLGISRYLLPLVFKPMFTTKTEGTGLGLALVERLMAAMNGSVSIESEENRYTKITLTLPVSSCP
jgi:nitrogen-specific signal transduction histidine kinase